MILRGWTGAVLGWALLHGTVAVAISPADKCVAAKLKVAGKYTFCRLKTDAKTIKTGARADYTACDSAFALKWARAEASGSCPTAADKVNIQNQLLADATVIFQKIVLPRFLDNGDGTVTDLNTGLMWEKKTVDGSVHDVNNAYTWTATLAGTAPDGDAFTIFLGTLNNGTSDGTTMSGCFDGHCDWRLPTLAELQGILDLNAPDCVSHFGVCIDMAFQPTAPFAYWSSTTDANSPSEAWAVLFVSLQAFPYPAGSYMGVKGDGTPVRAVRGP